jgi:hypothetical protein
MADDTANLSMYNLANGFKPEDIATSYQKGVTTGLDQTAKGLANDQMALQNQASQQAFNDQQAGRQAMKNNVITDENGNSVLDKNGVFNELLKTNPETAFHLRNAIEKHGLEETANMNEVMKNFYSQATPENWSQKRQALISSGHPEAETLPDVYVPTLVQHGLISTIGAQPQIDMMMKNREMATQMLAKAYEKGVEPDPRLYEMAGMPKSAGGQSQSGRRPGESVPTGERDIKAMEAASKKEDTSRTPQVVQIAQNNLLAAKNLKDALDYPDMNKIPTSAIPVIAAEMGKLTSGKAPTQDELEHMTPDNLASRYAGVLSKYLSRPVPANQGEFFQYVKDYANHITNNSVQKVRNYHRTIENQAAPEGAARESVERMRNDHIDSLAADAPDARINVIDKKGNVGHIPISQLKKALSQGYREQ